MMGNSAKITVRLWDALALLALFACALSSFASPTTRPATARALDPDLVAWWRADHVSADAAEDLSGHHHDAQAAAGKLTVEKAGDRLGFRFGKDARELVSAGAADLNFTGDFSIALWVK